MLGEVKPEETVLGCEGMTTPEKVLRAFVAFGSFVELSLLRLLRLDCRKLNR